MMELTCRRLASVKYFNYLRQGDYGFIVVCLSVSNFVQKLPNRFAWHFQRTLAMNKWLNFGGYSDHRLDTGIVFLFIIVGRYGVLKFCFVLFLVSVDVNNAGCVLRSVVKYAERSACADKVAVPSCWHTTSRHLVHHCPQFNETDRPQLPLLPMIMIVQMMSLTQVRSAALCYWCLTTKCCLCRLSFNWLSRVHSVPLLLVYTVGNIMNYCHIMSGRKGIQPVKNVEDVGGGRWLVRTEWCPAGRSVRLPLLIFPCTMKSRSSLLAPAHPGGPGKRAVKRLWCGSVT